MHKKYSKKNNGFTLTESLITLLVSSIVLTGFYQITFGSIRFFTKNKVDSDAIDIKNPSIELLSRYFDRWGVGVVTSLNLDGTSKTATQQRDTIPNPDNDKFIYMPTSAPNVYVPATSSNAITFFANLSGFGFVKKITGSTANLLSCRLDDSLGKKMISGVDTPCYYVRRDGGILPTRLDNDPPSGGNTFNGDSKIDSVDFATAFSFTSSAKECVDTNFSSTGYEGLTNANGNSTIGLVGTIKDSDPESLMSIITPLIPPATTFSLKEGDLIFRSPHKVEIFVDKMSDVISGSNDTRKWLFVKLTPVASRCKETTILPQPIALADSIIASPIRKADNSGDLSEGVKIDVVFRGESYQGQQKSYSVSRIFGG